MVINVEKIQSVQSTPDTLITFTNQDKIMVKEPIAGRVKTRMLGFQLPDDGPTDVFEEAAAKAAAEPAGAQATHFPAGWIIVVDGPGRGACFTIHNGCR